MTAERRKITMTEAQKAVLRGRFSSLDDGEFQAFLDSSADYGLDPNRGQFVALKHWDKKANSHRVTYLTGIDGFRGIAESTGQLAGCDAPVYEDDEKGIPYSCTVAVYRMVQGERCPFSAIAYWSEFYGSGGSQMAGKMPRHMLAKCAEALALRKGFSVLLSGIYLAEEVHRIEEDPNDAPSPQTTRETPAFDASAAAGATPIPPKQDLIGIIGMMTETTGAALTTWAKALMTALGETTITDERAKAIADKLRDLKAKGMKWDAVVADAKRLIDGVKDAEPMPDPADEIGF